MSGGEYNYFYLKIHDFADEVEKSVDKLRSSGKSVSHRELFVLRLREMSKLARAIEWDDSGDSTNDFDLLMSRILEKRHG